MSESATQALHDAIERNCAAILLMPAAGPQAMRTRFLGQSPAGIWIECPPKQQLLAETLQRSGKSVAVSFRAGEYLISFATGIRTYKAKYELSPSASVEGICLVPPAEISMTQRRAGYRAKVSLDARVKVSAWVVDEQMPMEIIPPTPGVISDLRDLSINGMGLIMRASRGKSPRVAMSDRMRVEILLDNRQLVVAARVRQEPRRLPDGSMRVGLNLEGLDRTIEGRRTQTQIAQLVAELQRTEARRRRAG